MVMSYSQVQTELQRKKNLGVAPTSQANMGQYNKLTPHPPMSANQVTGELQRKRNLGIAPTSQANVSQYNKLTPSTPMSANQVKQVNPGPAGIAETGIASPNQASSGVPGSVMATGQAVAPAATNTPVPPVEVKPAGFVYDPETDPAYQAAKRRIAADAQTGTNNAMVSLGSRGIGNSSSAVTAASQIQQAGVQRLNDTVIPQLEGQAYQRYQDDRNKGYQDEQLAIQKGTLTGYYESPEMQAQYDEVTQAKQAYANAKTPEERAAAHQRAETARAKLAGMNANAGLVGSNVTLDQANANKGKFGVKTAAETQAEWDRTHIEGRDKVADQQWDKQFDLTNTSTMAALTGHMPDGTPTTAEEQRGLENLWTVAGQTGTIPDKLADMYGIPHGTKTQAAYQFAKGLSIDWYNSQTSRQNANTSQDQADLGWYNAGQDGSQPPKYSGMSASQVQTAIKGQLYDEDGLLNKGVTPESIYTSVVDYGLPDGEDDQVMLSLGLNKQQIAEFDKKYGVTTAGK